MDSRTEPIRQDIDAIRDSMTEKMEQIESKIKGTVEDTTTSLKQVVDVKYQVGERPWAAFGLSVLAGFALGSIGGEPSRPPQPQPGQPFRYYPVDQHERPSDYEARSAYAVSQASPRAPEQPGLFDQLTEQFSDEISMLKTAAVTTLMGMVRDTLQQSMPSLHREYSRLRAENADEAHVPTASSPAERAAGAGQTTGMREERGAERAVGAGVNESTPRNTR